MRSTPYTRCVAVGCTDAAAQWVGESIPLCTGHLDVLANVLRLENPPCAQPHKRKQARPPADVPSLVYYAAVGDNVKIGRTSSPRSRWHSLAAAHGDALRICAVEPGGADLEADRHAEFAGLRVAKTEWFRLEGQLARHVDRLASTDWRAVAVAVHEASKARAVGKSARKGRLHIPTGRM